MSYNLNKASENISYSYKTYFFRQFISNDALLHIWYLKRKYMFDLIDSYPLSHLTIHQKHLWEPPLSVIMWFQKIAYLTLMDDEASSEIDLNIQYWTGGKITNIFPTLIVIILRLIRVKIPFLHCSACFTSITKVKFITKIMIITM